MTIDEMIDHLEEKYPGFKEELDNIPPIDVNDIIVTPLVPTYPTDCLFRQFEGHTGPLGLSCPCPMHTPRCSPVAEF